MTLGKHTRTKEGRFRQERSDTLVKTLIKDYPVLKKFNPRMKLGTLKERLNASSLDQVLKKARHY